MINIPFEESQLGDLLIPSDRVLIWPLNRLKDGATSNHEMMRKCASDLADNIDVPKHWKTIYTSDCGIVVKQGSECSTIKPLDLVVIGKYAGTEIKLESVDCLICREADVFMIFRDKDKSIGFRL